MIHDFEGELYVYDFEGDKVSWNTVIGLCSLHGFYEEALGFLRKMVAVKPGIQPDLVTVASVLPVCAETEDEVMVRIVHCYAMKVGLLGHVKVGNALVDVYGKCGSEKASKKVFDDIDERNVVSWNPIITSFSFRGKYMDALDVFRFMIDCNIVGGNWIEIPAGKYKKTVKSLSYCQLEFDCLYPLSCDNICINGLWEYQNL